MLVLVGFACDLMFGSGFGRARPPSGWRRLISGFCSAETGAWIALSPGR
jgi:hypothetical protein